MSETSLAAALRAFRKLAAAGPPDAVLLGRLARHRDRAAFEELVRRHGPLVWRVCRRLLPDACRAEDAFQSTFLLLARKAPSIRRPASVAAWLHGAAYRIASRARADLRRAPGGLGAEPVGPAPDPAREAAWRELGALVEGAVAALPERLRLPVLLCYWEGLTNEEAARRLGWPAGTVKGRLARARRALHRRLAAQGVALPAGVAALLLAPGADAAVPVGLAAATSRRAAAVWVGGAARGALAAVGRKWQLVAALALVLGAGGWAAEVLAPQHLPGPPPESRAAADAKTPASGPDVPRTDRYGDPLPEGALARLGSMRLRHGGGVYAIAYSPDGKLLASVGEDCLVRVWDAATGKEVRRLRGHQNCVRCVAFTRDGKLLASGGGDGRQPTDHSVRVWEVATGKQLHRLPLRSEVHSVAFSPDGRVVAGACREGTRLWEVKTGSLRLEVRDGDVGDGGGRVRTDCVAFSPDGVTMATAGQPGGVIRLREAATGKELRRLEGHGGEVWAIAFDTTGRSLASTGWDGTYRVWDVPTGKCRLRTTSGEANGIQYVAFSPDGKTLAGMGGKLVQLWDAATGKELWRVKNGRGGMGLAFSPDGRALAWGNEGAVCLGEADTGKPRFRHAGHTKTVWKAAFSPDGGAVLTWGLDGTVRVWESLTGRELHRLDGCVDVAFAPDGRTAACPTADGKGFRLWEVATGKELRRLLPAAARGAVHSAFSADGRYFAGCVGGDDSLRVWEVATGKEVRRFPQKGPQSALALSPDGRHLAAATYLGNGEPLRVWEVATGREARWPRHDPIGPNALAFSPDGTTLAAGDPPGVRFWDVRGQRECGQAALPLTYVQSLAFSPDGKMLAAVGGFEGAAYLVEVSTARVRARLEGHEGRLRTVAFSADGKLLVTGGDDGTPLVWDVTGAVNASRGRGAKLSDRELAACWEALAGEDAGRAWGAVRRLVAAPAQSAPFLRGQMAKDGEAGERLRRLIADLDSESFEARERASRELAALGKAAGPALRRAQEGGPAEVRRRAKALLARLDRGGRSGEEVRGLRAVEVLEHVGTAKARQALAELAAGPAEARLTREAKAALGRLAGRPAP